MTGVAGESRWVSVEALPAEQDREQKDSVQFRAVQGRPPSMHGRVIQQQRWVGGYAIACSLMQVDAAVYENTSRGPAGRHFIPHAGRRGVGDTALRDTQRHGGGQY